MIIQSLSPSVLAFLSEIENLGFSLCLVGGTPRDFLYANVVGNDFDFEIRPNQKIGGDYDSWAVYYKKLHHYLIEKKIAYTELPYLITRVSLEEVHFEFSSPRIEKTIPDNFSHHHFEAILDPGLNYDLSFRRRDITINAIGIELDLKNQTEKIINPFLGLEDLRNGVLRNITDDFFLDAVRFLRLIRFKLKFKNFVIDQGLYHHLSRFNLTKLSVHHFREELFKSRPGAFLNKFREIVLEKKLVIPEAFLFWTKYHFPEKLSTQEELLLFVFLQNINDAPSVANFFSMPEKKLKDLKSFFQSYEAIRLLDKTQISALLARPADEALKNPILKDLKNLEEKKAWRLILPETMAHKLSVDWDDWADVVVSNDELNKINPSERSYYPFYKTLKIKFAHD